MSEERLFLSADSPLKHPNKDELGYARFAEQLARAVVRMAPNDGLVISVNGSWGLGKSTVLNFMLHYLEQVEEDKRPTIVRFNPWWFSGREDLARLLIGQICAVLGEEESEFNKKLKKYLSDFTDVVSKLPSIPGVTSLAWLKVGKFFADSVLKQPSIFDYKEKIDNLLIKRSKKILVVIDDIDRLSPDEIRDLFRAIKATANFSNVVYLLAFDTNVVVEALEQDFVASGQQYLEKIVQVPFEIPCPDQIALRQLLFKKLEQIISGTPNHLFDQMYWSNIYFDGIAKFINTPREIVRLINVLRATYPAVEGEVNSVDFIAMETLRVFRPEVYQTIRDNENFFAGLSFESSRSDSLEYYRHMFERWIEQSPESEREAVRRLLVRIFPKLEGLFNNRFYTMRSLQSWRRQLKVCSPDIFPTYFRFSLAEGSVSATELQLLLDTTHNASEFRQSLINYTTKTQRSGVTKLRVILERLEDYTENDIPLEHIEPIICTFFDIGDLLLEKENKQQGMFDIGVDGRIGRLIYQLLLRIEEEHRFEILDKAIKSGAALSISEREVSVLGQQHGKFTSSEPEPESECLISFEHLSILEQLVLNKIRKAAECDELLNSPKLISILYRWKAWSGNDDEVNQWISEVIKNDGNLASFIEHFGKIEYIQSEGNLSSRQKFRLDPKHVEPFTDPDGIIDRVRRLIDCNDLTEGQAVACKKFVEEYDLRSSGKDPSAWW